MNDYYRDVRILVGHDEHCDGRWVPKIDHTAELDSGGRVTWFDHDPIVLEACDRLGRHGNGGVLYYAFVCTASYRCPARARVRKGWLIDHARDLLEDAG